jgi:2,4-dienoyl-CoA reductase-like NADH-dependent reductase (Old Yellow Enzyme family)
MTSTLFTPLTLRSMTLRNRIAVSPMCMYSAEEGVPNEWHLVHLGSRAAGGAGLIITEATAVEPRGRITWGCTGMYSDEQERAWAGIVKFAHKQGSKIAMQLAHAGRKASSNPPFRRADAPTQSSTNRWTPIGVTDQRFSESLQVPIAMTRREIDGVVEAFIASAVRCVHAGFDAVEIHAAHGYLLHSFYSPLSNTRADEFGGSFENRTRLLRMVLSAVRSAIPQTMPVLVRISATDWREDGWTIDDSVRLAVELKSLGVDLIDCSSGGAIAGVSIPGGPGYQVPLARAVRQGAGIAVGAVGQIESPEQAQQIIVDGSADLVLIGRESLRDPNFPIRAARALGVAGACPPPGQYERGW